MNFKTFCQQNVALEKTYFAYAFDSNLANRPWCIMVPTPVKLRRDPIDDTSFVLYDSLNKSPIANQSDILPFLEIFETLDACNKWFQQDIQNPSRGDTIKNEKLYIVISRHESSDDQFVTLHRTLVGAVKTVIDDVLEYGEIELPVDQTLTEVRSAVERGDQYEYDAGNIRYEITESDVWD